MEKRSFKVHGMHCESCEFLIEHKFKKIPGIEKVKVNRAQQKAEVYFNGLLNEKELAAAIKADGYTISEWPNESTEASAKVDYKEIGGAFLIIVAIYAILKYFNLMPQGFAIPDDLGLGFAFMIGLVAAFSSCIAVTGGLLLGIAAKYNENHPDLSGSKKFVPHIYFNLGRIVSYTVLGAAVSALGSALTLSPKVNGFVTIAVSILMILLGFQILNIFPSLKRFQPSLFKKFAHKIHEHSEKENKGGAFTLGALTFFLPCGFTQALQLYVLSQGEVLNGALIMGAFALGTLPALISLGALSSFGKGGVQKVFLKFAGVLLVMLGVFNVNSGIVASGLSIDFDKDQETAVESYDDESKQNVEEPEEKTETAEIIDGKQIVEMKIDGFEYYPNQFTVKAGIPVEWRVDASGAIGCGQILIMPDMNFGQYLSTEKVNIINFTPEETGELQFNCSMGMMTPGSYFKVIPNS